MEARPPPPRPFLEWADPEIIGVLAHAPYTSHADVRAVCRRLRAILSSPEFRAERLKENGHAERGIIVAGGYRDGEGVIANCWQLVGWRWRPIAPLSRPRYLACSAVFEGEMYVLGGFDADRHYLATVEAFNPETGAWRSLPPMSTPRTGAVCGVVGGSLIVAGGFNDDDGWLASAEAFTPATGWTPLPPMPHATCAATACVLNGRLFVVGGVDSRRVQMWDPAQNEWILRAELPAV